MATKKNTKTSIQSLYTDDFKILPANAAFTTILPNSDDQHYRVTKLQHNTRQYLPMSFYKIISPNINLD